MHTLFDMQQEELQRSWVCMMHTCMHTCDAAVYDVMCMKSVPNTVYNLRKQAMHGAIQVAFAAMHALATACP